MSRHIAILDVGIKPEKLRKSRKP